MQIHIKNERTDCPTEGAIGYSCGRFISRKLRLHGVHGTKLGNPHNLGRCKTCGRVHDRDEAIQACAKDERWQRELASFVDQLLAKHRHRRHVDLWCWCHPQACHCDLIKEAIEQALEKTS